jgi:hypothetical protein
MGEEPDLSIGGFRNPAIAGCVCKVSLRYISGDTVILHKVVRSLHRKNRLEQKSRFEKGNAIIVHEKADLSWDQSRGT